MLRFDSFQGFAKPIYLPVFQTAGLVEQAAAITSNAFASLPAYIVSKEASTLLNLHMNAGDVVLSKLRSDVCMNEAIAETWELSMWLLGELMGKSHTEDITTLKTIIISWCENSLPTSQNESEKYMDVENGKKDGKEEPLHELNEIPQIFHCLNVSSLSRVCSSLTLLVKTMQKHLPKRSKVAKARKTKDDSSVSDGHSGDQCVPKRPSSTSSLSTLSGVSINSGLPSLAFGVAGHGFKHYSLPSTKYQSVNRAEEAQREHDSEPIDTFRDSVRDNLRQLFDALRSTLKSPSLILPEYRASAEKLAESLSMMRQ